MGLQRYPYLAFLECLLVRKWLHFLSTRSKHEPFPLGPIYTPSKMPAESFRLVLTSQEVAQNQDQSLARHRLSPPSDLGVKAIILRPYKPSVSLFSALTTVSSAVKSFLPVLHPVVMPNGIILLSPALRFYSLDIPSCFLPLTKCDLILYQVSKRESVVPRKVRKQVQYSEAGGGCHLLPPPAGLLPLGVWSLTKEAPGSSLIPAPMGHSEKTQPVGQAVGPRRHQARWDQS